MIALESGAARVTVSPRGAELQAWSVAGHDILWTPDRTVWDAVAPILFPVVGWTRGGSIKVDGRSYPLGLHGFAAKRHFAVEVKTPTSLSLVDCSDEHTRALYPFDYRLTIDFALGDETLSCTASVTNEGSRPMPYAIGFHPGFRWPLDRPATVTFDKAEEQSVPVITPDGLFARERRPVALEGRTLTVTRDLMAREALCFLGLRSAGLTYETGGFGRLRIEHEDFPHVALWSRPPAPYLCIESWTGHGDPDDFEGELCDKPSMGLLPPGASARHAARYTFTPAT